MSKNMLLKSLALLAILLALQKAEAISPEFMRLYIRGAPLLESPEILYKKRLLLALRIVESENGLNLAHKATRQGTASGPYGLMPRTRLELARQCRDPAAPLYLQTPQDFEARLVLGANPDQDDKLALCFLNRIRATFSADEALPYAWLNGITGTRRALKRTPSEIGPLQTHWHVAKFFRALRLTGLPPSVARFDP